MLRYYIIRIFSRIYKFFYFFKNYKKLHYNLVKPAVYKQKVRKVLDLSKGKLSKKLKIIETTNQQTASKSINLVR